MPTNLYVYNLSTAGYALDSAGAGYNFSPLYTADVRLFSAAAVARDNSNYLYMAHNNGHTIVRSTDAGVTWNVYTSAPWPVDGLITDVVAHAVDDVHLFQTVATGAHSGYQGVWRSTNGGSTWTHILTLPAATQNDRGGGIAAGTSKLWFAESNTTPLTGNTSTFDIKTCSWDGSGVALVGSVNFNQPSGTGAAQRLKVRAIDDSFCLVVGNDQSPTALNSLYKISSTGIVTNVTPSHRIIWDVAIFDANTFVAAGPVSTSDTSVRISRTTTGGTSWTVVQTIPALQGFGDRGSDNYILMDVVRGTSDAYMHGYANFDTRPYLWRTVDGGQTWTSFRNGAALTNESGNFLEFGSGGVLAITPVLPLVSIPSRLATIVG